MSTHYIGCTASGRLVSRKSNRSDFTHAAVSQGWTGAKLPSFGTSADGAARNFATGWGKSVPEVVPVYPTSPAMFRAASKATEPGVIRQYVADAKAALA